MPFFLFGWFKKGEIFKQIKWAYTGPFNRVAVSSFWWGWFDSAFAHIFINLKTSEL